MRTMIYHVTHKKAGWTIDVHLNGLYVADVKYGNEPFLQKKRDTVCEAVKAAAIAAFSMGKLELVDDDLVHLHQVREGVRPLHQLAHVFGYDLPA
jgi:hypothetical protein